MGKYPVTNFEYQAFVQDTGHEPPLHWEGDQYPEESRNHPVVNVSWHDAVAYCEWLSKKTGKPYRLPREDEWEKAARGGVQIPNPQNPGGLVDNPHPRRHHPWGDEFDTSKCNTAEGGLGRTSPVGRYFSDGDNPYGLADIAGNVWEWCTDWLQPYPGNSSPDDDYGKTKVLRGSSWKTYGLAHCTFRYARTPESREDDMGFRCAKSSPRAPAKTRQPVNWEKVGAIAQVISLIGLPIVVIGLLIALGAWLVPNAADWLFKRPTVTPTSSPTHTPVISTATPTNTPFSPAATHTSTPVPPTLTPEPVAGATMVWEKDKSEMVYVPAGEFLMGFSESDVEAIRAICSDCEFSVEGEKPQHKVFLDAFYVDKTEVTNAQYRACVEAGACDVPSDTTYYDKDDYVQHPVVYVGWNDADAYCRWTSKRLPTEAEWEKVARGDEGRTWPWGNIFDGKKVNFCDKNCPESRKDASVDDGYAYTAPVGSYPAGASPYGALDMAGNVWEWMADWYDPDYYGQSSAQNPPGPDSDSYKVARGGSWRNGFTDIRGGYRYRFVPTLHGEDLGFRCAR